MRKPALNALRMFDAAARHGNFRLAAEELYLTQGAVAQQVRKLEADLDQALFSRLPRGLALTEAGARYHQDIRKALDLIDRATEALRPNQTTVTLSVPPSLASKWLVPRLGDFAAHHPDLTLDLRASERLTDFEREKVDLVIRQGASPSVSGLVTRTLAPLHLCAVANPSLVAQSQSALSLTELANWPLIEDGHRHWTNLFKSQSIPSPQISLSFNQTALAIDAAISGQGIAIVPRLLVHDPLNADILSEIWQAPNTPDAYHLLHPDHPHPARDKVVGWLLGQA
ncbi:transcriptional regulator, LysR family [Shimia gijangensis]|uniref:Transcriptional regulator, LysR family n=1 Tax=Shimia gijangensis TaxID=1470563 RepID=A0A1M6R658_9RHOB|nr:LysR substrate-binding domain-containing protein [Shimia gijangensis]SHK27942.1 transcriptional regulator, LysR family [Shimia gijangensis]